MVAFLACLFALAGQGSTDAADRMALTKGVDELIAPGAVPGDMVVTGKAFTVLTGQEDDRRRPLFVAERLERGRVLAGGHTAFFAAGPLAAEGNSHFFTNALTWLTGKPVRGLRVGLLGGGYGKEFLATAGATPVDLTRETIAGGLARVDVICMSQDALDGDADDQNAIMQFVKDGHGLLVSGPLWGWIQTHRGKDFITDHSGNRMLLPCGIAFGNGTVGAKYNADGADDPLLNVDLALAALRRGGLSPHDAANASRSIERGLDVLPGTHLTESITQMAASEGGAVPTASKPITAGMALARLKAQLDVRTWRNAPPEKVAASPAAVDFPGAVKADALRMAKTLTIDTSVPEWHSTGLYAAPGEVVAVDISTSTANGGLSVRVGPQTDTLWHLENWTRFPVISIDKPMRSTGTRIANPFGGLVYIVVPGNCRLGSVKVTISNAVAAPRFVRGETTMTDWKFARQADGPWADMEGKLVALAVPSYAVRDLDDPEPLMTFWDQMMGYAYDFFAAPRRARPERYCCDREIGGGYMHSGYPIMTHEDVARTFCNVAKLRSQDGSQWGFYHEMGHNFQQGSWTFAGTGEVTNNLFSVYASEKLNGITPEHWEKAHPALEYKEVQDRLRKYLAGGAKFADWQNDPFLALSMYLQVRKAFGWEPFTQVFAGYRETAREDQPRTEEEKHDQWMVRMSRAVKHNLGPFFVAWGVPTSETARHSIEDLPGWMPADWPR